MKYTIKNINEYTGDTTIEFTHDDDSKSTQTIHDLPVNDEVAFKEALNTYNTAYEAGLPKKKVIAAEAVKAKIGILTEFKAVAIEEEIIKE